MIRHLPLILQLLKRSVAQRYRGSVMGIAWALATPLLMLAVYGFVFSVVFQARWGQGTGARGEFAVMLFSGLILHQFLAECLTRSPTLILENPNFVKKVVFPLEILPVVALFCALFQLCVGLLVLFAGGFLVYGALPLTALWLPVILLPFVLLCLGIAWGLASLGVYLRDISQITGVLATILLFLSTVFYPAEALPETLRSVIYLNPLSFIVDQARAVALYGDTPDWSSLAVYGVVSLLVCGLGYLGFRKTRKGFADVV